MQYWTVLKKYRELPSLNAKLAPLIELPKVVLKTLIRIMSHNRENIFRSLPRTGRCHPATKTREERITQATPGLPQSEIAGNKEHHNNNTDDVKNIAHVSFSFLSRDWINVKPDAHNITNRGRREVSLVLPSNEAHWDLKFSDIIRFGVLHPVYAFKPLL